MRIIAFITYSADIAKILEYIGVDTVAPRASPQRAGHRFGMTAPRRSRARVSWASRIGIWQTNHHPTTPKISAPFSELAIGGKGLAGVGPRLCAVRRVVCDDMRANPQC